MAVVLIGFSNALAAPESVFSLLDAGHQVRAFTRKGAQPAILRYLPIGAPIEITSPETDATAAVSDLRHLLESQSIDVVMGLDDGALWLTDAAIRQSATPIPCASAGGEPLAIALDKARQITIALEAGLKPPPTSHLRRAGDLPPDMAFPAILKPSMAIEIKNGVLTKGETYYLESASDMALVPELGPSEPPYLVQPLIHGVGEGIFGFATSKGVVAWFGHRRIRMMNPHGSGASACRSIEVDEDLKVRIERFIHLAQLRGPFMIELLRDEKNVPWFIELNGRLWGSTALARRMGFEYPAWAVDQALDPDFVPAQPNYAHPLEVRHLGREILHALFVARGPGSKFHRESWPALLPTLCRVLAPTRFRHFYNYDPSFPFFFLKDAAHTVREKFKSSR